MRPIRPLAALFASLALAAGAASAQSPGWQDLKSNVLTYAAGAGDASNVIAWTGDPAFPPATTSISLVRSSDGP